MRKKMYAVLLALLLTFGMAMPAMAADTPAAVSIAASVKGSIVTASVTLSDAAGVTNGRIVVTYDAGILSLLSAEEGSDGWIGSLNLETAGKAALAWVGSDLAEGENLMLTLQFRLVSSAAASTELAAELKEAYRSGASALKEGGEEANTAYGTVNLTDGTVVPVQPLPDPDPTPIRIPLPIRSPDRRILTAIGRRSTFGRRMKRDWSWAAAATGSTRTP